MRRVRWYVEVLGGSQGVEKRLRRRTIVVICGWLFLLSIGNVYAGDTVTIPIVSKYDEAIDPSNWGPGYPVPLFDYVTIPLPSKRYQAPYSGVFFQNERVVVCYRDCHQDQGLQGVDRFERTRQGNKENWKLPLRYSQKATYFLERIGNQTGEEIARSDIDLQTKLILEPLIWSRDVNKTEFGLAFSRANSPETLLKNVDLFAMANVYYWATRIVKQLDKRDASDGKRLIMEIHPGQVEPGGHHAWFQPHNRKYPGDYLLVFMSPFSQESTARDISRASRIPSAFDPSVIVHEVAHTVFHNFFPEVINPGLRMVNEGFANYMGHLLLSADHYGAIKSRGDPRRIDHDFDKRLDGGVHVLGSGSGPGATPHGSGRFLVNRWSKIQHLLNLSESQAMSAFIATLHAISSKPFSTVTDFTKTHADYLRKFYPKEIERNQDVGPYLVEYEETRHLFDFNPPIEPSLSPQFRNCAWAKGYPLSGASYPFTGFYAENDEEECSFKFDQSYQFTIYDRRVVDEDQSFVWYLVGASIYDSVLEPTWVLLNREISLKTHHVFAACSGDGVPINWENEEVFPFLNYEIYGALLLIDMLNAEWLFQSEIESPLESAAGCGPKHEEIVLSEQYHNSHSRQDCDTRLINGRHVPVYEHRWEFDDLSNNSADTLKTRDPFYKNGDFSVWVYSVPKGNLEQLELLEYMSGEKAIGFKVCRPEKKCIGLLLGD